jgi:hypothetical protein
VKGEELTIGIGRGDATELSIIGCACGRTRVPSRLERRTAEGDSPVGVRGAHMRPNVLHGRRVGLLGNAAQNGWYNTSKAKYGRETDSEQVP